MSDTPPNGAGDLGEALGRLSPPKGQEPPAGSPGLVLISAADVEPADVEWLLSGVPIAYITGLSGPTGRGKSTVAYGWVARVSRGTPKAEPANVIVFAAEDEPATMLVPRLMAAGADLSRIAISKTARTFPEAGEDLEAAVEAHRAALVIVDPGTAFLGPGISMMDTHEVRQGMMTPLAEIAQRQQCAVVIVSHLRKSPANTAVNQVAGATAWIDATRSAFYIDNNPESGNANERLLAHAKNNLGPRLGTAVMEIVERDIGNGRAAIEIVRRSTSSLDAEDVMMLNSKHDRTPRKVDSAQQALEEQLADEQWHRVKQVRATLTIAGHAARTVTRAVDELDVEKRQDGYQGPHEWRLQTGQAPESAESGQTATTALASGKPAHDAPDRPVHACGQTGDSESSDDNPELSPESPSTSRLAKSPSWRDTGLNPFHRERSDSPKRRATTGAAKQQSKRPRSGNHE